MPVILPLREIWGFAAFKARPAAYIGRCFVMFLRYFNALFYLAAGINKVMKGWLWSDQLKLNFEQRLTELPADSFAAAFLQIFAIPLYVPTAYVVTILELVTGLSLLVGLGTRWGAALAVFINFMFGIGGYYDASLIALTSLLLPVILTPSGLWFGLDRTYAHRYPHSIWVRYG
jgi:thiosulfate dehydrogenase [quinone] large subunit